MKRFTLEEFRAWGRKGGIEGMKRRWLKTPPAERQAISKRLNARKAEIRQRKQEAEAAMTAQRNAQDEASQAFPPEGDGDPTRDEI